MTQIIPITELRKQIFSIVDRVATTGEEVEVEKKGRRIIRLVAIKDNPAEKAKYVLKYILPKLAGIYKNVPQSEFDEINEFMRGKKEKAYWKRKKFK